MSPSPSQTLLERALRVIRATSRRHLPSQRVINVTAFSGGVDSSLTAALVNRVFPDNSVACIGVSPALSHDQLQLARRVASHIGIALWECQTQEQRNPLYVRNQGDSCYHCKTTLYSTLRSVADFCAEQTGSGAKTVLYNGTNRDDLKDPTRLGLVVASQFEVVSPLATLSKRQVRELAKTLGLPNWNQAASPCLRSRLAFGIEASSEHLRRVEQAEDFVRTQLALQAHHNLRVRFLAGNRAGVELDDSLLQRISREEQRTIENEMNRLGFDSVSFRVFCTGSVSGFATVQHTS